MKMVYRIYTTNGNGERLPIKGLNFKSYENACAKSAMMRKENPESMATVIKCFKRSYDVVIDA